MKGIYEYEIAIRALHNELKEYPDIETLKDRLSRQLSAWQKKLDITIFRAENEQTGWSGEEIRYPIRPMPVKKDSGMNQTADYFFSINRDSENQPFGGRKPYIGSLLVERKGVRRESRRMVSCDLYSTLMNKPGRTRFKKEIQRFNEDERFDRFITIVECTYMEFLGFAPKFKGNKYIKNKYGASVESRIGTVAKFEARGCEFYWAGTREKAVEFYSSLIRQWCIHNYGKIMELK